MLLIAGLIGTLCAVGALVCGFILGRDFEKHRQSSFTLRGEAKRNPDSDERSCSTC
jgi:hypothetical protein